MCNEKLNTNLLLRISGVSVKAVSVAGVHNKIMRSLGWYNLLLCTNITSNRKLPRFLQPVSLPVEECAIKIDLKTMIVELYNILERLMTADRNWLLKMFNANEKGQNQQNKNSNSLLIAVAI